MIQLKKKNLSAEAYLTEMFRSASLAGIHAKRIKVFPKDIRLVQKTIWANQQPEPAEIEEGEREGLCVPRPAFKRLVEEIAQDFSIAEKRRKTGDEAPAATVAAAGGEDDEEDEDDTFTPAAIDALHEAAEGLLVEMMHGSNRVAVHTGRETIMPKDIQLWRRFTRKRL